MAPKETAIKMIQALPDSATWADIEERIRFLAGIDRGLADIKAGRVVPHEQVKESLKTWLHGGKRDLRDLVSRIPKGCKVRELDWGRPAGGEVQ